MTYNKNWAHGGMILRFLILILIVVTLSFQNCGGMQTITQPESVSGETQTSGNPGDKNPFGGSPSNNPADSNLRAPVLEGNGGGFPGKLNIIAPDRTEAGQSFFANIVGGQPPFDIQTSTEDITVTQVSESQFLISPDENFSGSLTLSVEDSEGDVAEKEVIVVLGRQNDFSLVAPIQYLYDHNYHFMIDLFTFARFEGKRAEITFFDNNGYLIKGFSIGDIMPEELQNVQTGWGTPYRYRKFKAGSNERGQFFMLEGESGVLVVFNQGLEIEVNVKLQIPGVTQWPEAAHLAATTEHLVVSFEDSNLLAFFDFKGQFIKSRRYFGEAGIGSLSYNRQRRTLFLGIGKELQFSERDLELNEIKTWDLHNDNYFTGFRGKIHWNLSTSFGNHLIVQGNSNFHDDNSTATLIYNLETEKAQTPSGTLGLSNRKPGCLSPGFDANTALSCTGGAPRVFKLNENSLSANIKAFMLKETQIGAPKKVVGPDGGPYFVIDFDPREFYSRYHVDSRVTIIGKDRKIIGQLPMKVDGEEILKDPEDIFYANNKIYVLDRPSIRSKVVEFNLDGTYSRTIHFRLENPSSTIRIRKMEMTAHHIYAFTSIPVNKIMVFNHEGEFVSEIPNDTGYTIGSFNPLLKDQFSDRVFLYITSYRGLYEIKQTNGQFNLVQSYKTSTGLSRFTKSIAIEPEKNRIIYSDSHGIKTQGLEGISNSPSLIFSVGLQSGALGTNLEGFKIEKDGTVIVSDTRNDRIQFLNINSPQD